MKILNRFTGSVVFESRKSTLKEALEDANLRGIDLRGADLRGANLRGADLRGANLRGVDFMGANLRGVDFRGANLRGADFRGANLRGVDLRGANLADVNLVDADLRGANLVDADLRGANLVDAYLRGANLEGADLRAFGDMIYLKTMQVDRYEIGFTRDTLQIGCKKFTISQWEKFTDEEISRMDSGALDWWKKWKDFIFEAIELSK